MQRPRPSKAPNLTNKRKLQTAPPPKQLYAEAGSSGPAIPTDEWEQPKRRAKPPPAEKENTGIADNNKFHALSETSDMDEDEIEDEERIPTKTTASKQQKPPPIYVTKTNMEIIIDIITNLKIPKKEVSILE